MTSSIETILYPGQVIAHQTLYSFWSAGDPVFGLVSPTGSGKSAIVRSLIARLRSESSRGRRGCKAAFVIVPQTHIQDSFRQLGDIAIEGDPTYTSGPKMWLSEQDTTTARLAAMLRSRGRSARFAATCSYQRLRNALAEAASKGAAARFTGTVPLQGKLLVVDEGHHAGESVTQLHALTKAWVEHGGRVLIVTATPYRNDSKAVFKDGQPRYVKTIAEYALDVDNQGRPLAPSNMWMCAERLSGYVVRTKKELDGDECPEEITGHATLSLTRQWEKDGRPKTALIVPSHGSRKWAEQIQRSFEKRGARVLNAVGTEQSTKKALRECLAREVDVTQWGYSEVDVIIACRRFDEGTDWPLCSHIYVIGFPRSLPLTIQRWGRTLRSKRLIEGHSHPNDAKIVFFCPDPSNVDEDTMVHHRQAAVLAACHLHDYQTAQQYVRRLRVSKEIEDSLKAQYDLASAQRLIGQIKPTEMDRAIGRKALQIIAVSADQPMRVPETCRRLMECKLKPMEHFAALCELLEDITPDDEDVGITGAEANILRHTLRRTIKKMVGSDTETSSPKAVRLVRKALVGVLNEVLNACVDIVVTKEQGIWRTTAMFTGETVQEISAALREGLHSLEEARKVIQAFFDKHGRRPTQGDDVVTVDE